MLQLTGELLQGAVKRAAEEAIARASGVATNDAATASTSQTNDNNNNNNSRSMSNHTNHTTTADDDIPSSALNEGTAAYARQQ